MRSNRPMAFVLLLALLLAAQPAAAVTRISGPLPAFGDVVSYQVTPDGSYVIYVADPQVSNKYELFSAPADGATPPVRLHDELMPDRELDWHALTPDGLRVVFAITREIGTRRERAFYSVPSDGSAPATPLVLPPGIADQTHYSVGLWVTNSALLIEFFNRADATWEVVRSDLNGAAPPQSLLRVPTESGVFAWTIGLTPDASRLIYVQEDYQNATLIMRSVATDGSALPVELDLGAQMRYFRVVGFSADTRAILLDIEQPEAGRSLWRVPLDGAPARVLSGAGAEAQQIVGLLTLVDERWAIFGCLQEDRERIGICAVPIDASQPVRLLTSEYVADFQSARLSPDGRRLIANGGAIGAFGIEPAILGIPLDGSGDVAVLYRDGSPNGWLVNHELIDVSAGGIVLQRSSLLEPVRQFALLPLAGGALRDLTPPLVADETYAVRRPMLSQDATRLIFAGTPVGGAMLSLYSVPLAGPPTAAVQLSAEYALRDGFGSFLVRGDRVVLIGVHPERGVDELLSTAVAPPALGFDRLNLYAVEGQAASFTVSLSVPATAPVSAAYRLLDGDEQVVLSGTLSLEPGQTSVQLPLSVPDDKDAQPDRTYALQLSDIQGAAPRITAAATVEVRDADAFRLALPLVSNQLYDFAPVLSAPVDAQPWPQLE